MDCMPHCHLFRAGMKHRWRLNSPTARGHAMSSAKQTRSLYRTNLEKTTTFIEAEKKERRCSTSTIVEKNRSSTGTSWCPRLLVHSSCNSSERRCVPALAILIRSALATITITIRTTTVVSPTRFGQSTEHSTRNLFSKLAFLPSHLSLEMKCEYTLFTSAKIIRRFPAG